MLFALRTGSSCIAVHQHRYNLISSPHCLMCPRTTKCLCDGTLHDKTRRPAPSNSPCCGDEKHTLLVCPAFNEERRRLWFNIDAYIKAHNIRNCGTVLENFIQQRLSGLQIVKWIMTPGTYTVPMQTVDPQTIPRMRKGMQSSIHIDMHSFVTREISVEYVSMQNAERWYTGLTSSNSEVYYRCIL